jgi:hypothetical protein
MGRPIKTPRKRLRENEWVEPPLNPDEKGVERATILAIEHKEIWTLSGQDRRVFVRALLHPPAPSPRMRAAARRYLRRVSTP